MKMDHPTPLLRSVLIIIEIILFSLFLTGCNPRREATISRPRVEILESKYREWDSIQQEKYVIDETSKISIEQAIENTAEKIVIIMNKDGDTIRTDREKTTVVNHLLRIENERLKAQVDSLKSIRATKEKTEIPVYINVPVEVERDLTAWERCRLSAFWWLLGGLAITVGYIIRKPVLGVIKRFIS